MLDLSQIVPDIQAMGTEARRRGNQAAEALALALRQAHMGDEAWAEAVERAQGVKPPWLVAACKQGVPSAVCGLPADAPETYTALATDGSQIPLDRHAPVPCFLLNVGEIALHYGTGERPHLASAAKLYYKDDDLYAGKPEAQTIVSEKQIATKRMLAESNALSKLVEEHGSRHAIALVDDPLILVFADQRESEREQRAIVDEFCKLLTMAENNNVPIAGYVSRPAHRDVVGALRLTLCADNCGHAAGSACHALAHLTDAQMFGALLTKPGDRSPLFGSAERSIDLYPERQKIIFFYLNTGQEIARVEVPQWVAESPDLRDQAHVLCFDQARKGQGYPICLAEAHERAVVRGPEREAFGRLVENAFVRERLPLLQTRKALSKRTRIV